jgi:hypothetical protein
MDELMKKLKEIGKIRERNLESIEELQNIKHLLKEAIKRINRNKLLTQEKKNELTEKLKDVIFELDFKKKFYSNYHLV